MSEEEAQINRIKWLYRFVLAHPIPQDVDEYMQYMVDMDDPVEELVTALTATLGMRDLKFRPMLYEIVSKKLLDMGKDPDCVLKGLKQ